MSRTINLTPEPIIEVVVLVLENSQGDILLTQRNTKSHLAGYWEFPGGKVEANESQLEALFRECLEEINYQPIRPLHILDIPYTYPDRKIHLSVYHESTPSPLVKAAEGQNMKWVKKELLSKYQLPTANLKIIEFILSTSC